LQGKHDIAAMSLSLVNRISKPTALRPSFMPLPT